MNETYQVEAKVADLEAQLVDSVPDVALTADEPKPAEPPQLPHDVVGGLVGICNSIFQPDDTVKAELTLHTGTADDKGFATRHVACFITKEDVVGIAKQQAELDEQAAADAEATEGEPAVAPDSTQDGQDD